MSGGSMNYLYRSVKDADFRTDTVLRRAFRAHLNTVANTLRAIEWNDSGDGDDREDDLIRECIGKAGEFEQANKEGKEIGKHLERLLK